MKFLCLGYSDPAVLHSPSEAEQEAIARECRPHDERLRASGRLVAVASLEHRKAATLRPQMGGHLGFGVEVRPIELSEQL